MIEMPFVLICVCVVLALLYLSIVVRVLTTILRYNNATLTVSKQWNSTPNLFVLQVLQSIANVTYVL